MELKLVDGDYVADGNGGQTGLSGEEALLQRILFRLTARREQFPLMPEMGSQLWRLGRESGSKRLSAARKYVAEALAEEEVTMTEVRLTDAGGGRMRLEVDLLYEGGSLLAALIL